MEEAEKSKEKHIQSYHPHPEIQSFDFFRAREILFKFSCFFLVTCHGEENDIHLPH
jgi:hypothetical protein